MRVRLPTPHAGWQVFATDVAIVVLGVLIALGLQQLVNDLSDRAAALRAKTDLHEEIGRNFGVMQERLHTQLCVDRRLDEIAAHLDRLSRGAVDKPPRWIGRPQFWDMIERRWDAASQSGRASLLSSEEMNSYTRIYAAQQGLEAAMNDEQTAWAQLRALEGQQRLSNESIFAMRSLLSQARFANWRIKLRISQAFEEARAVAIKPIVTRHGSRSVCIPMDTPRAIALTRTETRYGEP